MNYTFIYIGLKAIISLDKVVTIIPYGSSPSRRLKEDLCKQGKLIDATEGRRTSSLIITTSNHLIFCAVAPATLAQRLGLRLKKT